RALSRPQYPGLLPATSADGPAGHVAGGRDRRRAGAAHGPGLGGGAVGPEVEGVSGGGGERPAFHALAPGGWRDWWTLLHPPYTAWHLSYVAFGAVTATAFSGYRLGLAEAGFFLGVGVAAHALDEL